MFWFMKESQVWKLLCSGYLFFLIPNVDCTFFVVKPDFYLGNISSPLDKIRDTEIWPSEEVSSWPHLAPARSPGLEFEERATQSQKRFVVHAFQQWHMGTAKQVLL